VGLVERDDDLRALDVRLGSLDNVRNSLPGPLDQKVNLTVDQRRSDDPLGLQSAIKALLHSRKKNTDSYGYSRQIF
jgi:hypothetical protein